MPELAWTGRAIKVSKLSYLQKEGAQGKRLVFNVTNLSS